MVRMKGLDSRRYDAKPSFDFGFATLLGQSRLWQPFRLSFTTAPIQVLLWIPPTKKSTLLGNSILCKWKDLILVATRNFFDYLFAHAKGKNAFLPSRSGLRLAKAKLLKPPQCYYQYLLPMRRWRRYGLKTVHRTVFVTPTNSKFNLEECIAFLWAPQAYN